MARIPTLDGLRGIAILAVILFHIDSFFVNRPTGLIVKLYHSVASLGWSGVDLFFVLSGFLITGILYDSANKRGYFQVFYIRRALRIFPLYYAFLTLFFFALPPLLTASGHATAVRDDIRPSTQIFAWLYLVNWFSGPHVNYFSGYIGHFWSLSVEEQFYLLWPTTVKHLNRVRLKNICCVLAFGAILCRLVLYLVGLHGAVYTWTICRMDGIAIGAFIALCMRAPQEWDVLKKWAPSALLVSLVVFVVLARLSLRSSMGDFCLAVIGYTALAVLFGCCLVLSLSPKANVINVICSRRFALEAGKYSYGAYVLHQPLLVFLRRCGLGTDRLTPLLHSEALALLAVIVIPLMVTAIAAFGSWHLLEKHFLRLKEPLSAKVLHQSMVSR